MQGIELIRDAVEEEEAEEEAVVFRSGAGFGTSMNAAKSEARSLNAYSFSDAEASFSNPMKPTNGEYAPVGVDFDSRPAYVRCGILS